MRAIHDLPWLNLQGTRIARARIPSEDRGQNSRLQGAVLFEGIPHFVKVVTGTGGEHVAKTAREAFWLLALNQIGLAPRFRGLVNTGSRNYGIVMEQVPGRLWRRYQVPPAMKSFEPAMFDFIAAQLTETKNVLNANGIAVGDLQFLVADDARLTLIDPGAFKYESPAVASTENSFRFLTLRQQLDFIRQSSRAR